MRGTLSLPLVLIAVMSAVPRAQEPRAGLLGVGRARDVVGYGSNDAWAPGDKSHGRRLRP